MGQLNIHLNPQFEKALATLMRRRGIKNKSEAVRVAVQEALERSSTAGSVDFQSWLGAGKGVGQNPAPRFESDADLWG